MFKRTIMLKRKRLKKFPMLDYKEVPAFSLFLCGVTVGCITVSKSGESFFGNVKSILESYLIAKAELGFLFDFLNVICIFLIIPILMFVSGFSALGIPFDFALTALFGTSAGFYITLVMKSYSGRGAAFAALTVIPGLALCTLGIIKCCAVSSRLSKNLLGLLFEKNSGAGEAFGVTGYIKEFCVNLLPVGIGAAINAGAFEIFKALFDFIG